MSVQCILQASCSSADAVRQEPIIDGLNTDLHLDIGNGASLEKVDKFCYLGDTLDADGGCDSAVTARVRSAWKKFREYLSFLTGKGLSLKLKGKVYVTRVRSCLMYCCCRRQHGENDPKKDQNGTRHGIPPTWYGHPCPAVLSMQKIVLGLRDGLLKRPAELTDRLICINNSTLYVISLYFFQILSTRVTIGCRNYALN